MRAFSSLGEQEREALPPAAVAKKNACNNFQWLGKPRRRTSASLSYISIHMSSGREKVYFDATLDLSVSKAEL